MRAVTAAVLSVSIAGLAAGGYLLAQQTGGNNPSEPVPFQFQLDSLSLKGGEKLAISNTFRSAKTFETAHCVLVGRMANPNLHQSTLTLDHKNTFPTWNVHALLIGITPSGGGRMALSGGELFPLEMSVHVKSLQLRGPERLYFGLMDSKTFHNVASVSLGVQGFEKAQAASRRAPRSPFRLAFFDTFNPGDPGDKVLSQLEIGPAVSLVRAEEPQISGDIVLDSKMMPGLANAESVDLTLKVSASGEFSANGLVSSSQGREEFALSPKQKSPASFYAPRSRLDAKANLIPVLYAQTLPKVAIYSAGLGAPARLSTAQPAGSRTVPIVIQGIGFALDSKLEVLPTGGGAPLAVSNLSIGRDCLSLKAELAVPGASARSYSVRVTAAGNTVTLPQALSFNGRL